MNYAADRALQVAIEMELLGKAFYESLAAGCGIPEIASLAAGLAKEEETHVKVFKRMLDALPLVHRGPKLSEEELFLASKELRGRIMPNADTVRKIVSSSRILKALDMAIVMENDAISYYTNLSLGIEGLDKTVLINFVNEEKGHLDMLQKRRDKLFSQAGEDTL